MDGLWVNLQKRIDAANARQQRLALQLFNDIIVVQQRLIRRWNTLRKLLTEELPLKYIALLKSQSAIVLEQIRTTINRTIARLERRWEISKANAARMSDRAFLRLQKRWQELQPRLDNFVQTSFAISTATSTLQLTVQITPILLSALTVLATIPMLNDLLPEILLNSTALFFIMMAISAFAGYSRFKELETRAKLDGQIAVHEKVTKKQQKQLIRLKKRLKECEQRLEAPKSSQTYLPLSEKKSEVVDQDVQSNHLDAPSTSSEDNDYRQPSPLKR